MIAIGVAKSSGLIARVGAQKPCTSSRVPTHVSAYLYIRVLLTRVSNKERNRGVKEEREKEEREEEKELLSFRRVVIFADARVHMEETLKKNAYVISAACLCESCGPRAGRPLVDVRRGAAPCKSLATHGRVPATREEIYVREWGLYDFAF